MLSHGVYSELVLVTPKYEKCYCIDDGDDDFATVALSGCGTDTVTMSRPAIGKLTLTENKSRDIVN